MGYKRETKLGFTIIELLVVIGIIGLLSSVVLASVSSVRRNSRNTYRNNVVEEYVKAFSLYYATNGEYPNPGGSYELWYCLARVPFECKLDPVFPGPASAVINNAISEYIEAHEPLPVVKVGYSDWEMQGLLYHCPVSNGKCLTAQFLWFLEGDGASCFGYGPIEPGPLPFSTCVLEL